MSPVWQVCVFHGRFCQRVGVSSHVGCCDEEAWAFFIPVLREAIRSPSRRRRLDSDWEPGQLWWQRSNFLSGKLGLLQWPPPPSHPVSSYRRPSQLAMLAGGHAIVERKCPPPFPSHASSNLSSGVRSPVWSRCSSLKMWPYSWHAAFTCVWNVFCPWGCRAASKWKYHVMLRCHATVSCYDVLIWKVEKLKVSWCWV